MPACVGRSASFFPGFCVVTLSSSFSFPFGRVILRRSASAVGHAPRGVLDLDVVPRISVLFFSVYVGTFLLFDEPSARGLGCCLRLFFILLLYLPDGPQCFVFLPCLLIGFFARSQEVGASGAPFFSSFNSVLLPCQFHFARDPSEARIPPLSKRS